MEFIFDAAATVEASVYLLKKAGGRMNYTALLKILYLADRYSLSLWGIPITGSDAVSMENGPVLSQIYDLIKGQPGIKGAALWSSHIRKVNFDLELVENFADFKNSELSQASCELLDKLYAKFGHYTYGQLIDYCHKHCSEWRNPAGSSEPIHPEAILRALGKSDEAIESVAMDAAYYSAVYRDLGVH